MLPERFPFLHTQTCRNENPVLDMSFTEAVTGEHEGHRIAKAA
jgi:hypothetical protein